nr:hypothetical protein CYJ21_00675 [Actinomyces sp. UMB0138]
MMRSFSMLLLIELKKNSRQRILITCFLVAAIIAFAVALVSPRSYPITDARFILRFFQAYVMLGGFLAIVSGSSLSKLGSEVSSSEIELASPLSYYLTVATRVASTVISVIFWPFIISLVITTWQIFEGSAEVSVTVGSIFLIGGSGLISAVLVAFFLTSFVTGTLGIVASIALWGIMVFTPGSVPLPTLNGTYFSLLGDQYCEYLFGATPIFEVAHSNGSLSVTSLIVVVTAIVHFLLFGISTAHMKRRILK